MRTGCGACPRSLAGSTTAWSAKSAAATAWGLYLVLVTVGDDQGLSYYADRTLCRLLSLSAEQLAAGVLAYEAPLYQVLGLEVAP